MSAKTRVAYENITAGLPPAGSGQPVMGQQVIRQPRYKVTMIPDVTGWKPDDLRCIAGFHEGLWQEFTDPSKARDCAESATALGFAVSVEYLEGK